ncbi:MAG TPA: site-specific integrase [Dehalococcoidia bacterium]|nr:site-specific integrase [Dehalococcoidia bacterium]
MGKRTRANGEGSVYQRKQDGQWCAVIMLADGKRRTYVRRTRKEAGGKLIEVLKKSREGLPLADERMTVGRYLAEWLPTIKQSVRPKTYARYDSYVNRHIVPMLGRVRLTQLTPQHVQRLYADRHSSGLSPTTVHHIHACLHKALKQAVRWSLVGRNVTDLVDVPRIARHEMATFTAEQARAFVAAVTGDRLEAVYVLALTTGMRQGELLALKWRDVDLDSGTVKVRGTLQQTPGGLVVAEPKTSGSRRQVSITAVAIAALRRHRTRQSEERLRLGSAWEDTGFLFTTPKGGPIDADNLRNRSFYPLLKNAGLPRLRFHDLRHTAASLMFSENIHPKIVSDMLGHSRVSTTLDLYSHAVPNIQQKATEALDRLLAEG